MRGLPMTSVLALSCLFSTPIDLALAVETKSRLTEIRAIDLKNGINNVDLVGQGIKSRIDVVWRPNGNAHSRYMYVIQSFGPERGGWSLMAVQGKDGGVSDVIYDSPHTDEDWVETVRFVKAKLNGKVATLLITARRDGSQTDSIPDPTPVDFEIHELVDSGGAPGSTSWYFRFVEAVRAAGPYTNSWCALNRELRVPKPKKGTIGADMEEFCKPERP